VLPNLTKVLETEQTSHRRITFCIRYGATLTQEQQLRYYGFADTSLPVSITATIPFNVFNGILRLTESQWQSSTPHENHLLNGIDHCVTLQQPGIHADCMISALDRNAQQNAARGPELGEGRLPAVTIVRL